MSRSGYQGPKLPKTLLGQVDAGVRKKGRGDVSRKDRRRQERQQKKQVRAKPRAIDLAIQRHANTFDDDDHKEEDDASPSPEPVAKRPTKETKPLKSILKPSKAATPELGQDVDEVSDVDTEPTAGTNHDDESEDSDDSFTISRQAAKAGLADEDAEIAALERRLGVKGSKKSAEIGDDELDWLVTGSDSEDEGSGVKRKREGDERWLRNKRRRTGAADVEDSGSENVEDDLEGSEETEFVENPFSEDEVSGDAAAAEDGFEGFESDDEPEEPAPSKRVRENPYVAPVSKDAAGAGKYVPPSLRKPASSDEALKQLRRQVQGQLNRLSDANMLSILSAVEGMYAKNARQHVTMTLIDLLVGLVADPSVLNDSFLILHAGFTAALYKVVGTDFGAQMLEKLVEEFDRYHGATDGKHALNLVAFLSSLYALQTIGSAIMFDYIRLLLDELSESNTELLLRVIRTSGTQLRQDDPTALKDIVLLLQRNTAGTENVSVRTKFMIDTIKDLKNNRMKVAGSGMAAEHTTRMRKTLGSLNTRSSLKATEPLRITLADLKDSDKKGKWWLVGASYHDPAKLANGMSQSTSSSKRGDGSAEIDPGYESDTPGHTNLTKAAKTQGMNTDVRRMIFINIVGADDYKDAYLRLRGSKLKNKQQLEIPRVLVHCLGVEDSYNPYYGLLAKKLCEDAKMKKAFQFAMWDQIKHMSGASDADSEDEGTGSASMSVQKVVNLAKLFASLMAESILSLSALKVLDWALLTQHQHHQTTFAEVLLTSLMLDVRKKNKQSFDSRVREVFADAGRAPQMIQGLLLFLRAVVAKGGLANGRKEVKTVKEGCEIACETLSEVSRSAPLAEDSESDVDEC